MCDLSRFYFMFFARSFGQMNSKDRRNAVTKEDLARATLVTITNNIGSIARMCAVNEKMEKVIYASHVVRCNFSSLRFVIFFALLGRVCWKFSQGKSYIDEIVGLRYGLLV